MSFSTHDMNSCISLTSFLLFWFRAEGGLTAQRLRRLTSFTRQEARVDRVVEATMMPTQRTTKAFVATDDLLGLDVGAPVTYRHQHSFAGPTTTTTTAAVDPFAATPDFLSGNIESTQGGKNCAQPSAARDSGLFHHRQVSGPTTAAQETDTAENGVAWEPEALEAMMDDALQRYQWAVDLRAAGETERARKVFRETAKEFEMLKAASGTDKNMFDSLIADCYECAVGSGVIPNDDVFSPPGKSCIQKSLSLSPYDEWEKLPPRLSPMEVSRRPSSEIISSMVDLGETSTGGAASTGAAAAIVPKTYLQSEASDVRNEIILNERRFVRSLEQLAMVSDSLLAPPALLNQREHSQLFGSLAQLLDLHRKILSDLELRTTEAEAAEQKTPTPSSWKSIVDPSSGNEYYWNSSTGQVQWERPTDELEVISSTARGSNISRLSRLDSRPYRYEGIMVKGGKPVSVDNIADIFLYYMPFFMIYQPWIDNYDRASEVVSKLCEENMNAFLERLRKATGDQSSSSSSFMSLLIKPVQAVPRYRLLLDRLVATTSTECDDAERITIRRSGEAIQAVASKLNESLKSKAAAIRVAEIQNSLYPFQALVSPTRKLVREGNLVKFCGNDENNTRHYRFFLFNDNLVYGTELMRGKYQMHRKLRVISCKSLASSTQFEIQTDLKVLWVSALNETLKTEWLSDLKSVAHESGAD